jgi:hypothetical protein
MRAISGQNGLAVGVVSTSDVGKTQASIDNNTTGNPISISHVNSYTNPAQNISSGITVNSVTSNMAKSVSSGINVVRSDVLNTGKSISNGISTVKSDISNAGATVSKDLSGGLNTITGGLSGVFEWLKTYWWVILVAIIGVILAVVFVFGKSGGRVF